MLSPHTESNSTRRSSVDELEQIPVLDRDPHRPSTRRGPGPAARQIEPGRYLGLYAKYVTLFVGAGLISGAIVHYPLDKGRYALIGAAGAVLFALASAFGDARLKTSGPASLLKFVAASLVLALGIGMISGGIQHFSDIPTRAATLIPLGITLSVVAFGARDGHKLFTRRMLSVGVLVSAVVVWLALGLNQYATTFPAPVEGAGHHGAETATDRRGAAENATPAGSSVVSPSNGSTPSSDREAAEDHSGHPH